MDRCLREAFSPVPRLRRRRRTSDFSAELGDTSVGERLAAAGRLPCSMERILLSSKRRFQRAQLFRSTGNPEFRHSSITSSEPMQAACRKKAPISTRNTGDCASSNRSRAQQRFRILTWLTGDFSTVAERSRSGNSALPFTGNRIPLNRIVLEGLPLPGFFRRRMFLERRCRTIAPSGTRNSCRRVWDSSRSSNEAVGRGFLEYQFNRDTTDDPFNLLSGITNLPSFGARDALQTHTSAVNNTHVFSPALIHQVRFSMSYLKQPRTILDTGYHRPPPS